MYARVKRVYVAFIVAALVIIARLVWVMLPTSETAYNAERLESRSFFSDTICIISFCITVSLTNPSI